MNIKHIWVAGAVGLVVTLVLVGTASTPGPSVEVVAGESIRIETSVDWPAILDGEPVRPSPLIEILDQDFGRRIYQADSNGFSVSRWRIEVNRDLWMLHPDRVGADYERLTGRQLDDPSNWITPAGVFVSWNYGAPSPAQVPSVVPMTPVQGAPFHWAALTPRGQQVTATIWMFEDAATFERFANLPHVDPNALDARADHRQTMSSY